MTDDMALLKQAMEQMDAEDPATAQAAKDRAAQTLSHAKLSFSKMAALIEQRRLLLQPRIVANIRRMDQPGMLGDAAFRNTGSALRRAGQSFHQIAEAIENTGRLATGYEDPARNSDSPRRIASEPSPPLWRRTFAIVRKIVFLPLRRRTLSLAIALIAILLLYVLQGILAIGQKASGYSDNVAAISKSVDKAILSVGSFVHEQILRQSREATAPPTPSTVPIPSPPAEASPRSATAPAAPVTASAPAATAPTPSARAAAPPASPPAAPAPPSAGSASPPVSTPPRDARSERPLKSAASCGAAREDRHPCSRRLAENDRPRMIQGRMRRNSGMAGPCVGGVGGCYWGSAQY